MAGYYFEDLREGMTASFSKTLTETDVVLFAGITCDNNPVHLDEEFAQGTQFKGRIAHGMLTASFISTVLGTRLPGSGSIYVSQSVRFKAPVRIGDTVTAEVKVTALEPKRGFVTLETNCLVRGKSVVVGEATVMVPRRPA